MASGQCHLCGERRPLVDSHIITGYIFDPTYDDGHKIIGVQGDRKARRLQQSIRDQLLCESCDNGILNQEYEQPVRAAWRALSGLDGAPEGVKFAKLLTESGQEYLSISGLDYARLKLFLLAQFWRTSVTDRQELGDEALPPGDEERVREMLLTRDAGPELEYPIWIWRLATPFAGVSPMAANLRNGGPGSTLQMVFPNLVVQLWLHTGDLPNELIAFFALRAEGTLRMLIQPIEEFGGWESMKKLILDADIPEPLAPLGDLRPARPGAAPQTPVAPLESPPARALSSTSQPLLEVHRHEPTSPRTPLQRGESLVVLEEREPANEEVVSTMTARKREPGELTREQEAWAKRAARSNSRRRERIGVQRWYQMIRDQQGRCNLSGAPLRFDKRSGTAQKGKGKGVHPLYASVDHIAPGHGRRGHQIVCYALNDLKGHLPHDCFAALKRTRAWKALMRRWRCQAEADPDDRGALRALLRE